MRGIYVRWLELKMKHRDTWNDDCDLVFCTKHGTPMQPSNLLRRFRGILEDIGLAGVYRFHDTRHTANQRMKDAGVDAKVRAAILGHASVQITEEIYSHVSEEAKREAITRVSNTRR